MATRIAVARNWRDVASTPAETRWCQSVFTFAAALADAAKGGECDRETMIEMIVEAVAISSERFHPREELLAKICADIRFALTAPDSGDEARPN